MEDAALAPPVQEVGRRDDELRAVGPIGRPGGNEAPGILVRERPEDDGIEGGEDGGGDADAEAQGEDDGHGERRFADQEAEGVAHVVGKAAQHCVQSCASGGRRTML